MEVGPAGGQATVTLTRADVDLILAHLPRCPHSTSKAAGHKRVIPAYVLADFVAEIMACTFYRCGTHWHLTTPKNRAVTAPGPPDKRGPMVKPANLDGLLTEVNRLALRHGHRRYVYGTRAENGKWRYRWAYAVHRDATKREGER